MDFTEAADPQHRMLKRALRDDCWDVLMVGFNLRPAPLSAALTPLQGPFLADFAARTVPSNLSDPCHLTRPLRHVRSETRPAAGKWGTSTVVFVFTEMA